MAGLDQIAGIHFLHPSIGFLALALVMAFLSAFIQTCIKTLLMRLHL